MRWTKYRARYVINNKYHRVLGRNAKAGAASFGPVLLVMVLLAYWKYWLPVALIAAGVIVMIVLTARARKRRKSPLEPPSFTYDSHSHQPQSSPSLVQNPYGYRPQGLPPTMTGHDFEHYCAELLRQNGYTGVHVTKASGDNGVDIVATRDGIRHAIQTKYYASTVGNGAVQEVHAGRAMYQCNVGVVMTNSTFTQSAKNTAAHLGIVLWDGSSLQAMAARTQQPPVPPPQHSPAQPVAYYQPVGQLPLYGVPSEVSQSARPVPQVQNRIPPPHQQYEMPRKSNEAIQGDTETVGASQPEPKQEVPAVKPVTIHKDQYVLVEFLGCKLLDDEKTAIFCMQNFTRVELRFDCSSLAFDGNGIRDILGYGYIAPLSIGEIHITADKSFPTMAPHTISGKIDISDDSESIIKDYSYGVAFADVQIVYEALI